MRTLLTAGMSSAAIASAFAVMYTLYLLAPLSMMAVVLAVYLAYRVWLGARRAVGMAT